MQVIQDMWPWNFTAILDKNLRLLHGPNQVDFVPNMADVSDSVLQCIVGSHD